jgi:pimeloyl-ACP methyl ester carboxylesterase
VSAIPQHRLVGGLSVQFQQSGEGPSLVLVHGLLGYSFSWRRVLDPLSRNRQVFALDMPCSGFSECVPSLDGTLSATAERLLLFLDALQITSCDLVGSSFGGTTALFLAAKHPERIRTLTLVSPANPWSRIGRTRLALLSIPFVGRGFPSLARAFRPIHHFSVARMYGDRSRLTQETLDGYSLPLMRKGVFEHAVRIAKSWRGSMAELQSLLPAAADIPTLIVWGTKDRLVEPASAQALARHFNECRTVLIEGAGHLPYEECPEQFASALNAFLAEYSPAQVLDGK